MNEPDDVPLPDGFDVVVAPAWRSVVGATDSTTWAAIWPRVPRDLKPAIIDSIQSRRTTAAMQKDMEQVNAEMRMLRQQC